MKTLLFTDKYINQSISDIEKLSAKWTINKVHKFFINNGIDSNIDKDIIDPFTNDWSNIPGGYADILVRPKFPSECALILKTCETCRIPITISAGQTNLTGSATPFGGIVLSTKKLVTPNIIVDKKNKTAQCPIGIPLEKMRSEVLKLSDQKLYYPVDPTSRNDACIGGTISCNASGFIPGDKGSTRYWVEEIDFILMNGFFINIKRGEYISNNGQFHLCCNDEKIIIDVPTYERPKIKNASGPYSGFNEEIDFIDLIIGSEGIFGLITNCKLNLIDSPKDFLDLFIILDNESKAIELYDFLNNHFDNDLGKLTAFEYFGYNCQKYMKHKNLFFKNENDVGVYLQFPIFNNTLDIHIEKWIKILTSFDTKINLENVISLNDRDAWNKFFEARHSMPDNALSKTKQLGGISIITDTIVPRENFSLYLNKIHEKLQTFKIEYLLFGHLGDCHLHFHLIPNKEQENIALDIYNYMIDLSSELGGVYSAEHGTGKRKCIDFEKCYGTDAVKMVRDVKRSFDPNFLLNQGNVFN